MELTQEERAALDLILHEARFWRDEVPVLRADAAYQYGDLDALARAWAQLTDAGRTFIRIGLAQQAAGNPDFEAYDLAELASADPTLDATGLGRPKEPGYQAVIEALYRYWVARGNPAQIGMLQYRSEERQKPSPACDAISRHILELFPERFTARDPKARKAEAERQVDSRLRTLRKVGAI